VELLQQEQVRQLLLEAEGWPERASPRWNLLHCVEPSYIIEPISVRVQCKTDRIQQSQDITTQFLQSSSFPVIRVAIADRRNQMIKQSASE
jgi:hypothetical protein